MRPLRDRGWEITFITPDGPEVGKASAHGYRWLPLHFARRIDPMGDLKATSSLLRTLATERFTIVHTHNFKVSLVGRVLAATVRAPVVLHTIHGITWSLESPPLSRRVNAALERAASVGTDLILSQSESDCRAFLANHVVPPSKIRVVGNGVDLRKFDPARVSSESRRDLRAKLGVEPHEVLVLFPGRMVREKGLEEVFFASELLSGRGVRIAIAGREDAERGDAPSEASREVARRSRVLILGHQPEMTALYAAADIVGLASWREGMPRALIEGAAMERPLIATDIRGCRDIVRVGETGLLVPVRDAKALADGIASLAADHARRERMGIAARKDALARFDLNVVVGRVISAYDELLALKEK